MPKASVKFKKIYHHKIVKPQKIIVTSMVKSEKNSVFQNYFWVLKIGHFLDIYKCPIFDFLFTFWNCFLHFFKIKIKRKKLTK